MAKICACRKCLAHWLRGWWDHGGGWIDFELPEADRTPQRIHELREIQGGPVIAVCRTCRDAAAVLRAAEELGT